MGHKCVVQRLDDNFTTMEVTSSFGLWVWTSSPHRIPKIMWLTFANKAPGGLSSLVHVSEDRPDQWKRGMTFRVLLHNDTVEDYTNAPQLDGGEPDSSFRPTTYTLEPWAPGTVDGREVGEGSILAAPIPPLGADHNSLDVAAHDKRARSRGARSRREEEADTLGHDDHVRACKRSARSRSRRLEDEFVADRAGHARSRGVRGRREEVWVAADHDSRACSRGAQGDGRRRAASQLYRCADHSDRRRSRSTEPDDRRRSCSCQGRRCDDRELQRHHRHEDDNDEDRFDGSESRSSRGNVWASHNGGRALSAGHRQEHDRYQDRRGSRGHGGRRHMSGSAASPATPPLRAASPSITVPPIASPSVVSPLHATCRDWRVALLAAPAALSLGSSRLASPGSYHADRHGSPRAREDGLEPSAAAALKPVDVAVSVHSPVQVPSSWDDTDGVVTAATNEAWYESNKDASDLADGVALAPLLSPVRELECEDMITEHLQQVEAELPDSHGAIASIEDLFNRPVVPILPTPALPVLSQPLGKPTVRRSARLSNKPLMPAMDKALQVLHSKLGIDEEGVMPLEQARRLYVDKYKSPLPNGAIQALTTLFKLNVPSITAADEALIAMAGPGGAELVASSALEATA